jgi:hypothetical protein
MFKKDSFWFGTVLGLILPAIAVYFVEVLKMDIQFEGKNHLVYILTAAINLILVRVYYGKGIEQTARGIIAITFICAFAIFMYNS